MGVVRNGPTEVLSNLKINIVCMDDNVFTKCIFFDRCYHVF